MKKMNEFQKMMGGEDFCEKVKLNQKTITHKTIEVPGTPYHVTLYQFQNTYVIDTVLPNVIQDGCNGNGADGGQMFLLSFDYDDAYQLWSDDASKFEIIFGEKCEYKFLI